MDDPKSPVVLNYDGLMLKECDCKTTRHCIFPRRDSFRFFLVNQLKGPIWLGDRMIVMYLKYIENEILRTNRILIIPPSVTQVIKIGDCDARIFLDPLEAGTKDVIFFILNNSMSYNEEGTHWSVLVYSRSENRFHRVDSCAGKNAIHADHLVDAMQKGKYFNSADIQTMRSLQQPNSYDCGVYCLANIENIGNHFLTHGTIWNSPALLPQVGAGKRLEILRIVEGLRNATKLETEVQSEPKKLELHHSQVTKPRICVLTPKVYFREQICKKMERPITLKDSTKTWSSLTPAEQGVYIMQLKNL